MKRRLTDHISVFVDSLTYHQYEGLFYGGHFQELSFRNPP